MIEILAIGKKHEDWVETGIERYQKRLKRPFDIQWTLLPHSSFDETKARQEESKQLLRKISEDDYVILLDERGDQSGSETFTDMLTTAFSSSIHPVIVIGGAYGVDQTIIQRANVTLGLSKMVFPHQLVRLLIVEQLYRAQEIANGGKYHHA